MLVATYADAWVMPDGAIGRRTRGSARVFVRHTCQEYDSTTPGPMMWYRNLDLRLIIVVNHVSIVFYGFDKLPLSSADGIGYRDC